MVDIQERERFKTFLLEVVETLKAEVNAAQSKAEKTKDGVDFATATGAMTVANSVLVKILDFTKKQNYQNA